MDARARATGWERLWSSDAGRYDGRDGAAAAFITANGIDEPTVRRVLEALTRDCLAARSSEAPPCLKLGPKEPDDAVVDATFALAAEVADVGVGNGDTARLLVRLEARGMYHATMAIERVLERRWLAGRKACSPPSTAEIAAARAQLNDVQIWTPSGSPRPATDAERDDLAYLHAALQLTGVEVGTATEDEAAPELPAGSPELARHEVQRKAMADALIDGDVARHAAAAEAYLKLLGYPGPIRVAEETDARWGGRGFSYTLRLWARSEEILGHFDVAEPLHRRATPGGGMCGTSTDSVRASQMEGAIRAAEQREGCRPVIAERLFTPNGRSKDVYGARTLDQAGFDVTRLYRAALLDIGEGTDWSKRTRAISGYADAGGRDAAPRVVEIAERGDVEDRIAAIGGLEGMLRSYGIDPCVPSQIGYGHGLGNGEREVQSIMERCDTKLDDKARDAIIRRIAALAGDPDWRVREAVAKMLGATGAPAARTTLAKLARDTYDDGTTTCDGTTDVCEPTRPVKRAAKQGLEDVDGAAVDRRRQLQASRGR